MQKISFFQNRSLGTYYALFMAGVSVLVYQAMGWQWVGDSVNYLCLLFVVFGLAIRRWSHILENSLLMTVGYILPLLIRNSFRLTYQEAPSIKDFIQLAAVSSTTTLALGVACTTVSYLLFLTLRRPFQAVAKSKITTRF